MVLTISLALFIGVFVPWLKAHAIWVDVVGALILASLITSDDHGSASQREIANSFGTNVPKHAGSEITLKEVFWPDPAKDYKVDKVVTVMNTVGTSEKNTTRVTDLSAMINNHGNARIYDVYLKCRFSGRPPREMFEPELKGTSYVASDYHYGYIVPGSTQIIVRLEPNGYLRVADPSSFRCQASYQVEKSDLFRKGL